MPGYAARFRSKVRNLVLAGAPIDLAAASSGLSTFVNASPLELFHELVRVGDGLVLGNMVEKFWAPQTLSADDIQQLLQTNQAIGSAAFSSLESQFREWYRWTLDLPGTYYLEVIDQLFKRNALANGSFVALGHKVDLSELDAPLFLLAAGDDELVAPAQLFATKRLVGTAGHLIREETEPGPHLGLFIGRKVLSEFWPRIVRWMLATRKSHPNRPCHG